MGTFPTAIPSYLGFTATHTLAADTHAAQHNQEQADIVALATKMGTGASTPSANLVLTGSGTGTSSWSSVNLTTMVSGVLPVVNGGTGTTSTTGTGSVVFGTSPTISNPTISNPTISGYSAVLALIYPIGCIYTETTGTNPNTTFGFGTWVAFGAGRVLVGNGTSDQAFAAGATGGESNHTLTANETAPLNYSVGSVGGGNFGNFLIGTSGTTVQGMNTTAGGAAHNNLQPYIVVYFWKRTA